MRYRRSKQDGGRFFFTLVTYNRQKILTNEENILRLRNAFKREMVARPFEIDAIVILPDHLHTIWRLPVGESDYSTRWSNIKRYFSVGCVGLVEHNSPSRCSKREKTVWQRRFWEHTIRDQEDWQRHMDYIHYNPVKHGYAETPSVWPHSSFRKCVERDWYDEQWGASEPLSIQGVDWE